MAAEDIRIGKRNILIITGILAIFNIACLLVLIAFPSFLPSVAGWLPRRGVQPDAPVVVTPVPAPQPAPAPTPAPTPAPPATPTVDPGVPQRNRIAGHTVQQGDTFYELAGEYWGFSKLWPDLYVLNMAEFPDPDFISPGETIAIYNPLGDPQSLSPAQTQALLQAHVDTYHVYRRLGDQSVERGLRTGNQWLIQRGRVRINKAHWLLYSGVRFDRFFLDEFADQIQERDLRVVREYLSRFGYPALNDDLLPK